MANSVNQRVKKLYSARSKREDELHAIHEDILHCKNSQSRRAKIEGLVAKFNKAFMPIVDIVFFRIFSGFRCSVLVCFFLVS